MGKNLSKRRNKITKRRNKITKRRNKVSKRKNKISKSRSKVYNRQSRLFKYGGVGPGEARSAVQNKNYLIYFDDKLSYFTEGSMNFESGDDWYGLYSIERNGIYRKIIDENNEIIGIPVCCNQEEIHGLAHPYYIHGSDWGTMYARPHNNLWKWTREGFQNEKSSIPKEMFETLLEACNNCKKEKPNSTINLAFDWDQNLSKFEGLPVRAPNGEANYKAILNLYRGKMDESDREALMDPNVMCDFLFNGEPANLEELNKPGSRRHTIQNVLTELWNSGVGIVIISNSFSGNKLVNSGPKMFMDIMFEMGIWKYDNNNNFNRDDDIIRQLCLIGNRNSRDDSWKVSRLGDMMKNKTFEEQFNKRSD